MQNKLSIIFLLVSYFLSSTVTSAQTDYSYEKNLKSVLSEKLKSYDAADTAILNIKAAITLFEKSNSPKELIKLTAGIGYVLTDDDCNYSASCESPKVYGAMIYEKEHRAVIAAVRDRETKNPLGQNYINFFFNNDSRMGRTGLFNAFLKNAQPRNLTGTIISNKKEHVIIDESSVTFVRESEGWVIGLSTGKTYNYDDIFIYMWRTSLSTLPNEDILLVDASHKIIEEEKAETNPTAFSDSSLNQYINIERDTNYFSEMVETIVQHEDLAMYYHGYDFFIITNGRFRNDLDIKYKGKPVWCLPRKPTEVEHYLEFKSVDAHPDKDFATFIFEYPREGVSGKATFEKLAEYEYKLKDIIVVE